MKQIKNIFRGLISGMLALGFMLPVGAFAARDTSVDCSGRPRWDRFVVDEKSINWDAESAKCIEQANTATAAATSVPDYSGLYGAPKMYGEYEGGGTARAGYGSMYGAPGFDARNLYGKYDPTVVAAPVAKSKPAPIRAAAPVPVAGKTKQPVKAAPVKPKAKPAVKLAPVPKLEEPKRIEPIECTPPPPVAKPEPKQVTPDPKAKNIVSSLNNNFNIDSYCQQINPPIMGPLPKGLVLMPGRTDLMSCVQK